MLYISFLTIQCHKIFKINIYFYLFKLITNFKKKNIIKNVSVTQKHHRK